ncbi:MAG: AzlD domain-containing protein [Pseudomonadota bacterium]
MLSDTSFLIALALMTVATLLTRMSGPVLMAHVRLTPRVERFLEGLAVSVVAALVASNLVGTPANTVPVLGAVLVMLLTRSAIWAMLAGMVIAAALHAGFAI